MMGNQHSIGSGIMLLATIVFWNYALNWLSYRIHRLERLVAAPPLLIIRDGRLLYRNMRQEFLTEDECGPICADKVTRTSRRLRERSSNPTATSASSPGTPVGLSSVAWTPPRSSANFNPRMDSP